VGDAREPRYDIMRVRGTSRNSEGGTRQAGAPLSDGIRSLGYPAGVSERGNLPGGRGPGEPEPHRANPSLSATLLRSKAWGHLRALELRRVPCVAGAIQSLRCSASAKQGMFLGTGFS